jgi:hypothetical protein
MMQQPDLAARAKRCVTTALSGDAVVLVISEDERAEAVRLVGTAPVIVANRDECRDFLIFMTKASGIKPSRRR